MKPIALFAILLASPVTFAADLITSHVDIRFEYVAATNAWTCRLQYSGSYDEPAIESDPETVALPVRDFPSSGAGDRYTQPSNMAFAFTGATVGAPLWILPQSDRGFTWPGFDNAQTPGTFLSYLNTDPRVNATARWIKIQLVSLEYSGEATTPPQFSLWTNGSGGAPTVWMATSDGITASDSYFTTENTHSHLNWGFTQLGIYRVTLRPSAILANGTLVENGDHSITLAVGTLAQWRATHFSGPDIVDPGIGTVQADPDGDGQSNLLEYAFNTDPNISNTAPLVAGTGTAGLPLVLVENVSGQERLSVEFVRRKTSTNSQITYTPEFSSTLETGSWVGGGTPTVTSIDDSWERVKVIDAAPAGTRRFARVRISTQDQISY